MPSLNIKNPEAHRLATRKLDWKSFAQSRNERLLLLNAHTWIMQISFTANTVFRNDSCHLRAKRQVLQGLEISDDAKRQHQT
jgi:hypothetical protein